MNLPEIKFMGSEVEVESKRDLVSKNLHVCNYLYKYMHKIIVYYNATVASCYTSLELEPEI